MLYKRKITKKLGTLLLERKIITKRQLEQALQLQKREGEFLSHSLLKLGFATETDIASCLSSQYGFPYLPLSNYSIEPKTIELVPAELARQYDFIPIDKVGDLLTIVMVDPLDLDAIEELEVATGCKVQPFIGTKSDVDNAIIKYYGSLKEAERKERVEIIPPLAPQKFIDIKGKKVIERRRFVRLKAKMTFHYAFQEEYKEAETKDISAVGILFVSENTIPLWTFLILKIQIPKEKLPTKVVGQVVRIEALPDKKFDIAVHLTHLKGKDREKINQCVLEQQSTLPEQ